MHGKENVISPILSSALGVTAHVPSKFNTDRLGTFSGEVNRPGSQLETARQKAQLALEQTGETLAIASEGSFGPHPLIPWVASDRELVVLIDRKHQLEIVGQVLSTNTNFRQQVITTWSEAREFAHNIGFPDQGLIVRSLEPPSIIAKGVISWESLAEATKLALTLAREGRIQLETDMRALYNPKRMQVIQEATLNLVEAIKIECPQCQCPGFRVVQRRSGLPCGLCRSPTSHPLFFIYQCQRCQYQHKIRFPEGKTEVDPQFCSLCNP